MTAAEVLIAAADMIEKVGHSQRGFVVDGKVCALGAISLSAPTYDLKQEAKELLRERLSRKYGYTLLRHGGFYHRMPDGTGYQVISQWNNHWATTAEDVIALMRAA